MDAKRQRSRLFRFSRFILARTSSFPPIAQESRRISRFSVLSANLRVFARLICIPTSEAKSRFRVRFLTRRASLYETGAPSSYAWGRNIASTPRRAGLITGVSILSRAIRGGGPGWSRTNDVSNVTSLQPAAIATMLTDPNCRLASIYFKTLVEWRQNLSLWFSCHE